MMQGKQTCKILKEIRKQVARANDIEYVVSECQYKGDCLGTCPKCEAEVRYLTQACGRKGCFVDGNIDRLDGSSYCGIYYGGGSGC